MTQVTADDLAAFDPFGMPFRTDPFAYYPALVAAESGAITMEGIASRFVASHACTAAVLRDFRAFSSVKPKGLPGMERIDFFNGQPVMNYSDPPDHTRLRKVINASFTPLRVKRFDEATDRIIDALIDGIPSGEPVDVVQGLTKGMSIRLLLGALMNVDEPDWPIFLTYLSTLPGLDKVRPGEPKPQAFRDAWEAGVAYCRTAIELARREHSENLIGLIAAAAEEGGSISETEMMAMLVVLFSGGISTVAGAASACLLNLARNPNLIGRIRAEPALADRHLEESIRLDPPVALLMRFATERAELGGEPVPAGTPVYAMISAACHDPKAFPEPNRFDPDRPNGASHLGFGHGIHTCIGNNVTRACVPTLLRKLAARFDAIELAEPGAAIAWETTPRSRHIARLECRFNAR